MDPVFKIYLTFYNLSESVTVLISITRRLMMQMFEPRNVVLLPPQDVGEYIPFWVNSFSAIIPHDIITHFAEHFPRDIEVLAYSEILSQNSFKSLYNSQNGSEEHPLNLGAPILVPEDVPMTDPPLITEDVPVTLEDPSIVLEDVSLSPEEPPREEQLEELDTETLQESDTETLEESDTENLEESDTESLEESDTENLLEPGLRLEDPGCVSEEYAFSDEFLMIQSEHSLWLKKPNEKKKSRKSEIVYESDDDIDIDYHGVTF